MSNIFTLVKQGEKKKFIKFDCEIDNIKVNFELNDVTDGVQKNAKKLKDDFKKTEQEKLGSALGCKFKVISIYGYDQEGKRIKIGEVKASESRQVKSEMAVRR